MSAVVKFACACCPGRDSMLYICRTEAKKSDRVSVAKYLPGQTLSICEL